MQVHKSLFIFLILTVKSIAQQSSVCHGNSDCSVLINKNVSTNSCHMYNNTECHHFNFRKWTNATLSNLTSEDSSAFDVSIVSYEFMGKPAYNITLTISEPDIEGIVINLVEINGNYNSCRIFDFRNFRSTFKQPFSMYYDCYDLLDNNHIFLNSLTVRSLPSNKQLVYNVNVPSITSDECNSDTIIMILMEALCHNKVLLKFHKLPRKLNISQYIVSLIRINPDSSKTKIDAVILDANSADGKDMIPVMFENVDSGAYNLTIEPLLKEGRKCRLTYMTFVISKELPNYTFIGWIIGIPVIAFIVLAVLAYAIKRKLQSELNPILRKILMVYHPENDEFVHLVRSFVAYLEEFVPAKVFAPYQLVNEDSVHWTTARFQDADIVIIILSDGILNKQIHMPAPPPYGSLFWQLCEHISSEILNSDKTCIKVYFKNYYSIKTPDKLRRARFGPQYELMKDFKKLFCHLKNISSFWSFFFWLPEKGKAQIYTAIDELLTRN